MKSTRVKAFHDLPTFPQDAPMAWAAACGAVSAVGIGWDWTAFARLLAAIALLELVCRWAPWVMSQGAQQRARRSKAAAQPAALPYTLPDSPAQRAAEEFARAGRAWRAFFPQPSGFWARTLALLVITGLLLCYGMGAPAMWLGLGGLLAAMLCGFWLRTAPEAASIWSPAFLTALAWTLGALAAGGGWSLALATAAAFGLAASGIAALRRERAWGKGLFLAGLALPAVILVAFRLALPAAAVLFIAAPAFALLPGVNSSPGGYAAAVRRLAWLSMLATALALGLR